MRRLKSIGPVRIRATADDRLREVSVELASPLSEARGAFLRRTLGPLIGWPELTPIAVRAIVPIDQAETVARIVASVVGGHRAAVSLPRVEKLARRPSIARPTLEELLAELAPLERRA